ncbi:YbfB/YjiJ family MFS transporter [Rhodococcus hoagii]|nr:YbfB/YjiJ family MFS transporter [Prescottella equi]
MSFTKPAQAVGGSGPTLSPTRTIGLAGAGLSLIAVCYGLARFAYGLFVPEFRESFTLTAGQTGLIAAAGYASYCVGVVAATTGTPRLGARAVAVAAGSLATAGTALIAVAPNAVVLAAGVTIAGVGTGVASPPLGHAIALRVVPRHRDRIQTIVNAGTGLGVAISGPVALLAEDRWRAAWLAFAAVAAAVTVWVRIHVPSAVGDAPGPAGTDEPTTRHAVFPSGALRVLGAAAVVGAATAAVWTFGQELLVTVGGHDRTLATTAWIVLGVSGLLGAVSGELVRRVGLQRAWTISTAAVCAATALLAAASRQPAVAVAASALFGAVYIAVTGVLLVWSTRVYPTHPATGVGLAFLLVAVGQSAAAPVLGFVADRAGLTTSFWMSAGVALAAVAVTPPARFRRT